MPAETRQATLLLLAALVGFLGVAAAWVWHDARLRGAKKPAFAALLTLLQGPLWLAFYLSDRPLCADERREGGFAWNMARHFSIAWSILNGPTAVIFLGLAPLAASAGTAAPGTWGLVGSAFLWCTLPLAAAAGFGYAMKRPDVIEVGGAALNRAGISFVSIYTLATLALWGVILAVSLRLGSST